MTAPVKLTQPRAALLRLLFAMLALFVAPLVARAAGPHAAAPGLPFAIADFDGDQRPDVASVQSAQGFASSGNDYWVRLHLSAFGQRYIRIEAPKGGLRVEARDVNGDHHIDLVFASAGLDRPVAVLLNDGQGNFSQADPAAFAAGVLDARSALDQEAVPFADVQALTQEWPVGLFPLARSAIALTEQTGLVHPCETGLASTGFFSLRSARAPPALVLL